MKRLLLFPLLIGSLVAPAQQWTWVRGSASNSVTGVYGSPGTASPLNDPSGRHGCATWTDETGNLWLFGGEGYTTTANEDLLNDLWKYDVSTNEWTWVRGPQGHNSPGQYGTKGVASATNEPGAREFTMSWTDTSGTFWLFGGEGYDANGTFGMLSDLWKYDPATNQWTWVHGPDIADQSGQYGTMGVPSATNTPGARHGSGYWRDSLNNLWLFGGEGWPASGSSGWLNDLWRYTPSTNSWCWMKGTSQVGQAGVYGTLSVTATGNLPGGRSFPASWTAKNGDLYLFGGVGHGTMTLLAHIGDLWKYQPATNNWTWLGGHYGGNFGSRYGTLGNASPTVVPGCRQSPATWVDELGKLWMFGGFGYAGGQASHGNLNDLFSYDPLTGLFTWEHGDTLANQGGVQGTQGITSPLNKPGGRHYNTFWKHTPSKMWLFGGLGVDDSTTGQANRNDLWVLGVPCNPDSIGVASGTFCAGSTASLSAVSPDGSPVSWYSSATATSAIASGSLMVTPPLTAINAPVTFTYYMTVASCSQRPRTNVTLTVYPLPQLSVAGTSTVCDGGPITLTATGATTYTWSSGENTSVITLTASAPVHNAVVLGADTNGCENSETFTVNVHALPSVSAAVSQTSICQNTPVSFSVSGATSYSWNNGSTATSFTTSIAKPATYTYVVTGHDATGCSAVASVTVEILDCVGIDEFALTGLSLFPNPGTGLVNLRVTGNDHPAAVEIADAYGRLVLERNVERIMQLELPPGIYFARITGSSRTVKIVIY